MSKNALEELLITLDVNGKSLSDITYIGTSEVKISQDDALFIMKNTNYDEGDYTIPFELIIKGDDFIMFRSADENRRLEGWSLIKINPILPTKEVSISSFDEVNSLPSSNPSDSPYPVLFDADDYDNIAPYYTNHEWPFTQDLINKLALPIDVANLDFPPISY